MVLVLQAQGESCFSVNTFIHAEKLPYLNEAFSKGYGSVLLLLLVLHNPHLTDLTLVFCLIYIDKI